MAVAQEKAPRTRATRLVTEPTPLQRLENKATAYVELEERKRELQAELNQINGTQLDYRADILDLFAKHPELLKGKKSVALDVATLTLRTAKRLVDKLDGYSEEGLKALLKRFKVEAYELKFNATAVVKAAGVVKGLADALPSVGCDVRDVESLAITPVLKTEA